MVQAEATMQTIKEVKSSCQIQKASLSIPIKQAYAKSSETENEVENKEVCRKHGRRQVVRTSFSFLAHSCSRRCDTSTMTAREEEARAPAQARGGEQQQQLAIEKTKVQSDDENEGARNDDQVDGILRAAEREVERERERNREGDGAAVDLHLFRIRMRIRLTYSCALAIHPLTGAVAYSYLQEGERKREWLLYQAEEEAVAATVYEMSRTRADAAAAAPWRLQLRSFAGRCASSSILHMIICEFSRDDIPRQKYITSLFTFSNI